jgi:hypothetical protein
MRSLSANPSNPVPEPAAPPGGVPGGGASLVTSITRSVRPSLAEAASDDRDPNPTVTCTPPSGSFFPVGTTTVNCQATDASGNIATGSFLVHVYPPLQLDVTVNGQGAVSPQTGVASISGTVACSRAISVDLSGLLKQLFAKRVTISGAFSTHVDCAAPSTGWSASVIGDNGRFGAGPADVTLNAYGCELSCHSASVTRTIRLIGK